MLVPLRTHVYRLTRLKVAEESVKDKGLSRVAATRGICLGKLDVDLRNSGPGTVARVRVASEDIGTIVHEHRLEMG